MEKFDPIAYINEPRWQESRLGLERITELLERLGRPQDKLKFVHVAGTNGKGSTCAFISSILKEAGYKVGLFTSPYILQFEERIRVNGENISAEDLYDVTLAVRDCAEAMAEVTGEHPTEFELMTAVAFEHFARSSCDIVVAEVGMGGRLDSTNIIESPEACVIVRMGLDHTDMLGDTLAAIATEKAGIIKEGAVVVSWPQDDPDAMAAIEAVAKEKHARLVVPSFDTLAVDAVNDQAMRPFSYEGVRYETRLLGSYQPYNAVVAIEAAQVLAERGWDLDTATIVRGVANTSWPGRFEVVEVGPPPVVIDGGHNAQGAAVLAESLRDVFPGKRVTFLMSVLADKDYKGMIAEVAPLASAFVCATPPNPRALSAADLAEAIRPYVDDSVVRIEVADGFADAKKRAVELADQDGVICAFGSLYSISSLRKA